jgi:3-hydroxybutyryl-CoA dehydrogenase
MLTGGGITRAGVVGAGLMGRAIAGVFARAGIEVTIFDAHPATLDAALAGFAADGLPVRGARSAGEVARGAGLVTEAVPENLELKQAVFAELDAADPDAILATNTSVLPVGRIAEPTTRPGRVVGTHWWNPAELIPIVEVIPGEHTDGAVLDATEALLTALGKTAVRVRRDVAGFIGNRLQHALWREAIALVREGICDARTVDLVVRNTIGLRLAEMGPIENADFVGLDLTLAIHDAVLPVLCGDSAPSPVLRELVAAGRLGARSGDGFLHWEPGDREAAAARLARHVRTQLSHQARADAAPAQQKETA